MKPRLSNPVLADRGCRLAGIGFTDRLVPRPVSAFSNAPRPSTSDEPSLEAGPQAEASLAGTGSRMLADREGRPEGEAASADLPAISSPSQETAAAAGVTDLPAPAAFSSYAEASEDGSSFTNSSEARSAKEDETCPTALPGQARAAPDVTPPASGAVALSDPSPGFCRASEGQTAPVSDVQPSSAGAVDLSEASAFILSLIAAHEGRSERDIIAELIAAAGDAIGLSPLLARGAEDIDDLADLPDFARKAANRFRGGRFRGGP